MERLLIIPKPKEDECITGYIYRLSYENRYDKIRWIYDLSSLISEKNSMLNLIYSTPDMVSFKELSTITNLSEDIFWQMTYYSLFKDIKVNNIPKFSRCISTLSLSRSNLKYCPSCLKEEMYYKKNWNFTLYTVCTKHLCLLINRCPSCNILIGRFQEDIFKCKCGFDFVDTDPVFVERSDSDLSNLINIKTYNRETEEYTNNNILYKLQLNQINFIVLYFFQHCYGTLKKDEIIEVNQVHDKIIKIYNIFSDWPNNFHNYLSHSRGKYYKKDIYIREAFGPSFYRDMLHKFYNKGIGIEIIIEEFIKYLNKNWDGGHLLSIKPIPLIRSDKFITRKMAMSEIDVSQKKLDDLIDKGHINAKFQITNERKRILVEIDSINKFKNKLNNRLIINEVCLKLGLKRSHIIMLINNSILKAEVLLKNAWYIDKEMVYLLKERLNQGININQGNNYIDLRKSLLIFSKKGKSIVDFVKMILNENITVKKINEYDEGFSNFLYCEDQLRKYLYGNQICYSPRQLEKLLKIDRKDISFWIKANLLQADMNHRIFLVDKFALEEFMKKYITLGEIITVLKKSGRNSLLYMATEEVYPISGKNIDGGSAYLFERIKVEKVLYTF